MKKEGISLFLLTLLILNIFIITISVQTTQASAAGGIDEETGLPKEFSKFKETANNLSEKEKREAYLKQEWTKLFAKNAFLGPILFYTNKFFITFNPFWKIVFGIEFSWSWVFIFSLLIWLAIIYLLYSPAKAFLRLNPILNVIAPIIIASIAGMTGTIRHLVDILVPLLTNRWSAWLVLIVIIFIIFLYNKIIKQTGEKYKEQDAKEKVAEDREVIGAYAGVPKKALQVK